MGAQNAPKKSKNYQILSPTFEIVTSFVLYINFVIVLREGFNKNKNIKSYGIFHTGGGRGLPDFHNFFREKNLFFSNKIQR